MKHAVRRNQQKKAVRKHLIEQFLTAVQQENLHVFKRIASFVNIDVFDKQKATPLMYAAKAGKLPVVQWLIEEGAQVNAQDENQETALFYAIRGKHLAIMSSLIECGATIHHKNKFQESPLIVAAESALHDSDIRLLALLLNAGADIDAADFAGKTPLMHAAGNDLAVMHYLIARGADIHRKDCVGDTALMYAAFTLDSYDRVVALVNAGAIATIHNRKGKNAIDYAQKVVDELKTCHGQECDHTKDFEDKEKTIEFLQSVSVE